MSKRQKVDDSGKYLQKRGRSKSRHPDRPCGECTVWLALGQNEEYRAKHNMSKTSHPQERAELFSSYLSKQGKSIQLNDDSCLCIACYTDAHRYSETEPQRLPRCISLHKDIHSTNTNHCIVCHTKDEECTCQSEEKWYKYESWSFGMSAQFWQK